MARTEERPLRLFLVTVGLLFTALGLSLMMFVKQVACVGDDAEPVCHTSTFFLLLAARSPSANRSLIPSLMGCSHHLICWYAGNWWALRRQAKADR